MQLFITCWCAIHSFAGRKRYHVVPPAVHVLSRTLLSVPNESDHPPSSVPIDTLVFTGDRFVLSETDVAVRSTISFAYRRTVVRTRARFSYQTGTWCCQARSMSVSRSRSRSKLRSQFVIVGALQSPPTDRHSAHCLLLVQQRVGGWVE